MIKKCFKLFRIIVGNILKIVGNYDYIIMYVDGGFSSQMIRYCKGMWFKEHGMKVKYDLAWYKYDGMDNLGTEKREWRLMECFPDLEIDVASDRELLIYRRFLGSDIHNTVRKYQGREEELKAPLYVARYDFDYLMSNFQQYSRYFNWESIYDILNKSARNMADEINRYKQEGRTVIGVHVRRGDMTVTGDYWKVLTPKYFFAAIEKVATDNCILYFFSNGFDFVRNEILPNIKHEYRLADMQNKDYEDMYLYSVCNVQISSQGSWGRIAYCFNKNKDRRLIFPNANINEDFETHDNGTVIQLCLTDEMYL